MFFFLFFYGRVLYDSLKNDQERVSFFSGESLHGKIGRLGMVGVNGKKLPTGVGST